MSETTQAAPRSRHSTALADASRWDTFKLRDDDIIIDTWGKSGTTLLQQIVAQLLFSGDPAAVGPALSPWLDFRMVPPEVAQVLDAQTHRRFIKTHLPQEALPWRTGLKYIYVGRDVRDVIWSWHNHTLNFTDSTLERLENVRDGHRALPATDPDVRVFYNAVLEDETLLHTPFWAHIRGWWAVRNEPNVLLLHFADLISDMPGQIRRIAAFLDTPIDEARFGDIVAHCQIDFMRGQAQGHGNMDQVWKGGADTFFNKGTNGRWREVLSPAEVARADEVAASALPADCAHWLRTAERA